MPDASTFSQNRCRRFTGTTVYQALFDEIVRQVMERGMVDGRVLYTDSTHLKANANKGKFDVVTMQRTPSAYLAEPDTAVDADRAAHGKKPLKRDDDETPPTEEIKVGRTDPEGGYMVRDDKLKGFFYLDHRTVDAKHAIITDTYVTPASVHNSMPYLGRLDRQPAHFGFPVSAVRLDPGYFAPAVCQGLEQRGIAGVMGYRTPNHKPRTFYKRQYHYDAYRDEYLCSQGQALAYSATNRIGYREYKSNAAICQRCSVRPQCTNSANGVKIVVRHVWERTKEAVNARRLTEWGKRIYVRRKETVERSFANAKQLHGQRYAKMRGLRKLAEQCLLGAACQNMKKIGLLLARLLASLNVHVDRAFALMRHFLLHDAFPCRSSVF